MPQFGTVDGTPAREDFSVFLVADDNVNVREVDREACITDWPNANECLFKSRHDVPCTGEVSWEIGDTKLGRRGGMVALPRSSADGNGGRVGVDLRHWRISGKVEGCGASVGDASSRATGAAVGEFALILSGHFAVGFVPACTRILSENGCRAAILTTVSVTMGVWEGEFDIARRGGTTTR